MVGRMIPMLLWAALSNASAQLPLSGTLSDTDWPLFRAEVAWIENLLTSASDKNTVMYEMARVWASAKQWPETIVWLRRVAEQNAGIDPSRDSRFAELRETREFVEVMAAARRATPPVSHSKPAFRVAEGDLVPESVAYDPKGKIFYFGSMRKGKVVRCSGSGNCMQFAAGLGTVLGLKVQGRGLWLLSNSETESALIHYDLETGLVVRRYPVNGTGHNFNDLAISGTGAVYLTDTRAGAVWFLANGATQLERLAGKFEFANGIALSSDGKLLYVSTFGDGISVVDLKTHEVTALGRPAVVRFTLTRDLRGIARFEVLERRNPLFDGVTTGVVAGREFFFMANIQDDKNAGFDPIVLLKIHL
jgi:hypothetical protein